MSDQEAHEREYIIFDPDGPITLSEHELVNDYMRLRQTPGQTLDEYEKAAQAMPWHLRWWYVRKAKKARAKWDARRNAELARVIHEESNPAKERQ